MGKSASGSGNLRKKEVYRNGKEYVFWEGRATVGIDPATGKAIRRSVTAPTQKEARKKLSALICSVEAGMYQSPVNMTVAEWVKQWLEVYAINTVKPYTITSYRKILANHIKPRIGGLNLQAVRGIQIQKFYNDLLASGLSAKTVRNIAAVLHKAFDRAMKLEYIRTNPCDAADLPRVKKREIKPLTDEEIPLFLAEIEKSKMRNAFAVCLFTGMREGELLGLSWDNVDFDREEILVCQQLQRGKEKGSQYYIMDTTKNGTSRNIKPPSITFDYLRHEWIRQQNHRKTAGSAWEDQWNLVFTNEAGRHLAIHSFYKEFKKIAQLIGRPDARPHDLRHTCATTAIAAGADIKSVQSLMGHATASFTLDRYAHTSERMRQDTANRLQDFYANLPAV